MARQRLNNTDFHSTYELHASRILGVRSITVMHVDLNLIVALDALRAENSDAAAAERLHLSAPAMSHTVTRIRRATDNDILVRTGRAMTATPWATSIGIEYMRRH